MPTHNLMKRHSSVCFTLLSCIIFAMFGTQSAHAQESYTPDSNEVKEWHIRPKLSFGVGMMNYQGDLIGTKGYFNPFQNKAALHVNAAQPINEFLDLNFFMLYGALGADERTLVRNLNFRSRITAGGMALSYNFDHLLKPDRRLEPYVSLGFEAFDFESKTDLVDSYGNVYYYWSDGTIRNLPETNENLNTAIEVTRDYVYETDVRELNADGLGDYPERAFAIPVGAGFNFLINQKVSFKMGMEYHWTFTDYIDGITEESRGIREGNKQSDKFLHTFMRLTYDLTPIPHEEVPDFSGEDNADTDQDSIADFLDDCPGTPLGVQVDEHGCPLDSDGDGVVDYLDQELNSPEGAVVDSVGVAMSDSDFEQMYLEWTDESGQYSTYTSQSYSLETAERKTQRRKPEYSVRVGEFEEAIDDSLANELLSRPNVSVTQTEDGKTIIEMTGFEDLPTALEEKVQLESEGIETSDVMETNTSGETTRVTTIEQDIVAQETFGMSVEEAIANNKSLPPPSSSEIILDRSSYTLNRPIDPRSVSSAPDDGFAGETVYRVQIGAFANKLSNDVFAETKDLLVITTSDGLTRYYVGAFTSYEQAASRKIDMLQEGFEGSYVVPFRDGQRATLQSSGATPAQNVVPKSPQSSPNYGKVKFKVQVGAYAGQIPQDMVDRMIDLGKVDQRPGDNDAVRYLVGEFNTYEEAKAYKEQLVSQGFEGAFTVAEYNGSIISAQEGIQLLK